MFCSATGHPFHLKIVAGSREFHILAAHPRFISDSVNYSCNIGIRKFVTDNDVPPIPDSAYAILGVKSLHGDCAKFTQILESKRSSSDEPFSAIGVLRCAIQVYSGSWKGINPMSIRDRRPILSEKHPRTPRIRPRIERPRREIQPPAPAVEKVLEVPICTNHGEFQSADSPVAAQSHSPPSSFENHFTFSSRIPVAVKKRPIAELPGKSKRNCLKSAISNDVCGDVEETRKPNVEKVCPITSSVYI